MNTTANKLGNHYFNVLREHIAEYSCQEYRS